MSRIADIFVFGLSYTDMHLAEEYFKYSSAYVWTLTGTCVLRNIYDKSHVCKVCLHTIVLYTPLVETYILKLYRFIKRSNCEFSYFSFLSTVHH